MGRPGVGPGQEIPVIVKVAKLETSLTTAGAGVTSGNITFDKESDEVVLIYGADLHARGGNGLGTGTQLDVIVSRDPDEATVDYDDEDTMIAWAIFKSFVTSGMSILFVNQHKNFPQPLITSRPQLRVVAEITTATWANGKTNVYLYYTTRKLTSEAMRVLVGGD
jgi:hypothetical protein